MLRNIAFALLLAATSAIAADSTLTGPPNATSIAATAVNTLGIELLGRAAKPDQNALLSPYSIQSALAMTYAGADGVTRDEMAKVLHYPKDEAELHHSFAALRKGLDDVCQASAKRVEEGNKWSSPVGDPITLVVANRLFGQADYDFRAPFLRLLHDNYAAPFEPLDFAKDAAGATRHINGWVEDHTRQRIRNVIPDGTLNDWTRLVLVNAIHLRASWAESFMRSATKPTPFHLGRGKSVDVPMMWKTGDFAYYKGDGFSALALPYSGYELGFLVILPDKEDGFISVQAKLTPDIISGNLNWENRGLWLRIPKFELHPPLFPLGKALREIGMRSAFDQPLGSANFDRIAPRRPDDYLAISEVFHKTYLKLDEKGTEAAAATAAWIDRRGTPDPDPIELLVDHPFLFAIQHRASGACLFLGRVVDPR